MLFSQSILEIICFVSSGHKTLTQSIETGVINRARFVRELGVNPPGDTADPH